MSRDDATVLHQLLILGEAVKRLSEAFRAQHPQLPWKAIAGMRDTLIHGYDEVWKTTASDIPHLISLLERWVPTER